MTAIKKTTQRVILKSTKSGLQLKRVDEEWQKIGAPIRVRALALDTEADCWLAQIQLRDVDNKLKLFLLSRDDVGKQQNLKAEILRAGYVLPDSKEDCALLLNHLANKIPKRRIVITNRLGWRRDQYVFPKCIIGKGTKEIIYRNSTDITSDAETFKGTIGYWQETICYVAQFSSRMRFCICLALLGPLLNLLDGESFGTNLSGDSANGKTTLMKIMQTVFRSLTDQALHNWDMTPAGLDEAAAAHCDQILVIDELGRANERDKRKVEKVRDTAYRLASGKGRVRSVHYGPSTSWRLTFASSSETALSVLAAKQDDERPKGETVRLIDLPAVVHPEYGIFESVPEGSTSEDLVNTIDDACLSVYGVVGRAYVKKLAANRQKASKTADRYISAFMTELKVPMNGWERRFAKRFAMVYAAGMLGVDFGILPWERSVLMQTCKSCYTSARATISNYEDLLTSSLTILRQQLENVDFWVDLKGGPTSEQLKNAAGFHRNHSKHGPYFAVKPKHFEKWLGEKLSPKLVATHLRNEGHLITTRPNVDTKQVKITELNTNRKFRYYCIKASFLAK